MKNTPKTTSRKFYRKWLYKISFTLPGCWVFRENRINLSEGQINWIMASWDMHRIGVDRTTSQLKLDNLLKMSNLLCSIDRKLFQYRIEGRTFDVYTSTPDVYRTLVESEFSNSIIEQYEPNPEVVELLNDPNNEIVKEYPHGRYRFKVFLNPAKLNGNISARENVANWLLAQNPKIHCTETVADWFETARSVSSLRYVLVDDDATLLLLKLRAGGAVSRIYNYIKV